MTKLIIPKRLRTVEAENVKDLLGQLDGYFMACKDDSLVLLTIQECQCIAIFKETPKLIEVMNQIKAEFNKVRKITDAREFLGGVSKFIPGGKVKIIINPQFNTDSGKLHYTEMLLES